MKVVHTWLTEIQSIFPQCWISFAMASSASMKVCVYMKLYECLLYTGSFWLTSLLHPVGMRNTTQLHCGISWLRLKTTCFAILPAFKAQFAIYQLRHRGQSLPGMWSVRYVIENAKFGNWFADNSLKEPLVVLTLNPVLVTKKLNMKRSQQWNYGLQSNSSGWYVPSHRLNSGGLPAWYR